MFFLVSGPIEGLSTNAASTVDDVNKDDNNNAIIEQSGLPFSKGKVIYSNYKFCDHAQIDNDILIQFRKQRRAGNDP